VAAPYSTAQGEANLAGKLIFSMKSLDFLRYEANKRKSNNCDIFKVIIFYQGRQKT
jgi:hypothetical protein